MAKKVVSVLISMILIFSLSASVFAETKSELQKKKEEAQENKDTRIIILKLDGMEKIGVIVDEVREVVELSDSEVEKVAYDSREEKQQFVSAVGKVGDDLISLLDLHTVISE